MKRSKLMSLALLLLAASSAAGQSGVRVTYYDGTTQPFNVNATGKLFFTGDNLNVKQSENAGTTTIPVSIIRKITLFDTSALVVPVNLAAFSVSSAKCIATANWESGIEGNFDHYELQYGNDVVSMSNSLKIAGKGSYTRYTASVADLKGKVYFRLKMVDLDGSFKYSDVIVHEINCGETEFASLYPNPSADVVRIKSNIAGKMTVRIYSPAGQVVAQGVYTANQDINIAGLPAGLYLVQVNNLNIIKLLKK